LCPDDHISELSLFVSNCSFTSFTNADSAPLVNGIMPLPAFAQFSYLELLNPIEGIAFRSGRNLNEVFLAIGKHGCYPLGNPVLVHASQNSIFDLNLHGHVTILSLSKAISTTWPD
jgi:hypothetical protein